MRVIALRRWNDHKENVRRNEGDVFTVSKERYEEIMAYMPDLVQVVEESAQPEAEQPEAEQPEAEAETEKKPARRARRTSKAKG